MSPFQREARNEAIEEPLGPCGPPGIRVWRHDQCGSVERGPEARGKRREVPVPMRVHHVGAARHRPADHRGRDDSESVWRVEELPSANPGNGEGAARWIRGEPRERDVAHQVGCEDLNIDARLDEPFRQMIPVLFNPTDGRRKTLCQLDYSRLFASYGSLILS